MSFLPRHSGGTAVAPDARQDLLDRIKAAARIARAFGHEKARLEERTPGVKTRILDGCAHRGQVKDFREAPCCGGKVRREELFGCSQPENESGEAWSIMCQGCGLPKAECRVLSAEY